MFKLAKHLKPFIATIIVAISLLFVQAMSELALPDYLSNIVDKGIQQGGIVNAVPEAIRKSQMDKINLFMEEDEIEKVIDKYILIDNTDVEYKKYKEDYPIIKDEPVYVLKDINEDEIDEIEGIMNKGIVNVFFLEQAQLEAEGELLLGELVIPKEADMFSILSNLPKETLLQMNDYLNQQVVILGDQMISQSAIEGIKEEYKMIGMKVDNIQNRYIINTGLMMLFVSLIGGIATVLVGLLAARVAAGFVRNIRKKVFEKVESFSSTEFDKFSTASLITRTTNDLTQVQMLVFIVIRIMFYAPIMGVGGVIRALNKSASMSWVIALAVIVLLGLILTVFVIAMPKFKLIQKLLDRLNLVTRENLSGMMVIRAFNTQEFEEERFEKANQDITKTSLFVNRVMAFLFPAIMFIMNGITLLIVWVGADRIANASMQVGDMMAFMQYAIQIIFSFLMMSMMFIMIPRASVSANRVAEVLNTEIVLHDPKNPKKFDDKVEGLIEFDNVSFRYSGAEEDMLKDISFKAKPGETTAIIGSTGSGKTTLINMIPRFYDVTKGNVLIDGIDVRDLNQHDLRDVIGYVPQKGFLFSGTIESNLRYADKDASEDIIEESAEIAQAMEFIKEKEKGFDSDISQGGINVSGGQKQRLAIARALVKKPKVFVFDDSFSALDFKTDFALRKALKKYIGESTVIIVAQRISTIMNAEQIIVLDEGRIVGQGTHKELMDSCITYQEIALSQLSKEELA